MIIALDDHITGGRLDQNLSAYTSLWKAREAFANWEIDLLQKYAMPLADTNRKEVSVEVIISALQLLGYDAERRAQYSSARQFSSGLSRNTKLSKIQPEWFKPSST